MSLTMKVLTKDDMLVEKEKVVTQIKGGAVFIYPTDTIYGIGCDATNKDSVEKIRKLKGRYEKPFSVIAPSKEWIEKNCIITSAAKKWIAKLPGPYTLILKLANPHAVAKKVTMGVASIGVRMPDHWFSKISEELNIPIVTTSANKAGGNFMTKLDDLTQDLKVGVDFIVYEGEKAGKPSTLVHLDEEGREQVIER